MATASISSLDPVNEQSIAQFLTAGYHNYQYYHNVGQVLLKINPYPQFSYETDHAQLMRRVLKPSGADELPKAHIYIFAENIRRAALDSSAVQGIILRGMNGSGKTEAFKAIVQYMMFADCSHHSEENVAHVDHSKPVGLSVNPFVLPADASLLCKKLRAALCVLTAFSSVTTDKNAFSTRAMKYLTIKYSTTTGKLTAFRLRSIFSELVRTSCKDPAQGPLLIQALLMKGAGKQGEFNINTSIADMYAGYHFGNIDFTGEFNFLQEIVLGAGVKEADWQQVLKIVGVVCLLQGVGFIGTDSTLISSSTKGYVPVAETLLGVEAGSIFNVLMKKPDDRIGRPPGSLTDTKPTEAKAILDSLCANLISKCVCHLLDTLSVNIPLDPTDSAIYADGGVVHILDTVGWERLGVAQFATFPHLVNHYFEERFNQLIVKHVFNEEIEKYSKEGVQLEAVAIPDWAMYIELLDKPLQGVMSILDEISLAQRSEDKLFVDKVFTAHGKSKLVKVGGPKAKPTAFTVRHSFSDVAYDCEGFIAVHKLGHSHSLIQALLKTSSLPLAQGSDAGYETLPLPKDEARMAIVRVKSDSRIPTAPMFSWNRSKDIYNRLMNDLNTCTTKKFVLCLAAHLPSLTSDTPADLLVTQVKANALENIVALASKGFAYSKQYLEFYNKFRYLAPFQASDLPLHLKSSEAHAPSHLKDLVQSLLQHVAQTLDINVDVPSWQTHVVFGNANIFMKDNVATMLEERSYKIHSMCVSACSLLQSVLRMMKYYKRYKVARYGMIILQSAARCKAQRQRFLTIKRAAALIKSTLQMRLKRKVYVALRNAVNTIKHHLLGKMIQRIRFKRLIRATKAFQNVVKGFLIRNATRTVYSSVRLLQIKCRQFVTRQRLLRLQAKSIQKLQKIYRGYSSRKQNFHIVTVLKVRREQRLAVMVVTKLQSFYRMKRVIGRFQEVFNAAIVMQAWCRCVRERRRYKLSMRLIVWLQSQCRRLRAMKYIHSLRVSAMLHTEALALQEVYAQEVSVLQEREIRTCLIGKGLLRNNKGRFARKLITFDLYFDLSFAYPEGWLRSILNFYATLQQQGRDVYKIVMGSQHTVIVDDKFDVYTFGLGDLGQLGHSNRVSCHKPKAIELLPSILHNSTTSNQQRSNAKYSMYSSLHNIPVKDLCCGRDHTLLLTSHGQVYSWGDNRRGQLGHSHFDNASTPRIVTAPYLHTISTICAGAYHSGAMSEAGVGYVWGAGECVGRSDDESGSGAGATAGGGGVTRGSVIGGAGMRGSVFGGGGVRGSVGGGVGGDAAGAVTDDFFIRKSVNLGGDSRVYGDVVDVCMPQIIHISKKKLVTMCAGENHMCVVSGDSLYAWGKNTYGQLGIGNKIDARTPTKVLLRPIQESELLQMQLLCGGRHMLLVLKGKMWLWGWNKYGQIGNGSYEDVVKPTRIHIPNPSPSPALSAKSPRTVFPHSSGSSPSASLRKTKSSESVNGSSSGGDVFIRCGSVGYRHSMVMVATSVLYAWGVVSPLPTYAPSTPSPSHPETPLDAHPAATNIPPRDVYYSIPTYMIRVGGEGEAAGVGGGVGGGGVVSVQGVGNTSLSFTAIDVLVMEATPSLTSTATPTRTLPTSTAVSITPATPTSAAKGTRPPATPTNALTTTPSKTTGTTFKVTIPRSKVHDKLTTATPTTPTPVPTPTVPISLNYTGGEEITMRFKELRKMRFRELRSKTVLSSEGGANGTLTGAGTSGARGRSSTSESISYMRTKRGSQLASHATSPAPNPVLEKVGSLRDAQLLSLFTPRHHTHTPTLVPPTGEGMESKAGNKGKKGGLFGSYLSASKIRMAPPSLLTPTPSSHPSTLPAKPTTPSATPKVVKGGGVSMPQPTTPSATTNPAPNAPLSSFLSTLERDGGMGAGGGGFEASTGGKGGLRSGGVQSFHDQMKQLGILRSPPAGGGGAGAGEGVKGGGGSLDPLERLKQDLERMKKR